jgi:predicted DNA-binding transcriptional regulator
MPNKDQSIGAIITVGCLLGILVYAGLVFLTQWNLLVLQLTGFIAVGGILAIGSWIGWTMATTPPPKPIENLETEHATTTEEKVTEETQETGEEKRNNEIP